MYYYYDGYSQGYIDEDIKSVEIDSFKTNDLTFRPIGPPFFNYIKSIIKYSLETKDSISTGIQYFKDSIIFSLTIFGDKQVEFFGSPTYIKNPYNSGDEISRYDIWINKSDYLPYKYRRRMSTNTSWETCRDIRYNMVDVKRFSSQVYLPTDYTISVRGKEKPFIDNLTGTPAPGWTLSDTNHKLIALTDLKSKVLLIQFTGIGCGPCHASIPFLKHLAEKYKNRSFELVSIETWSNNIDGIKRYCLNNNIDYKFLLSTKDITNNYQIRGVPVFFILDENRIIRKIIRGYEKEKTDKEITETMDNLFS
jgi:thiol-disulfide isomerase/thioredoxin